MGKSQVTHRARRGVTELVSERVPCDVTSQFPAIATIICKSSLFYVLYIYVYDYVMYVRYDMDHMTIEEDRDAVTAFFRAQPLHFDGTRRSVYIDVWLHDMEQIFQLCHVEGHLRVRLAARCLYGEARLWWIETGEREVPDHTWM